MKQHSVLALLAAMVLAAAEGVADSGPATGPGLYYHFQNITRAGDFETGHMRGNPGHWVGRHERQEGPTNANKGHVRWYGEGSSGLRVWDLAHADHEGHVERQEHHAGPSGPSGPPGPPQPHRKSSLGVPGVPAPAHLKAHPDCILGRLRRLRHRGHPRQRRSAHATLITRDCAGNPLEPPGVRLSPGPPRPRQQPRSPSPPPLPLEPWRQEPSQPPPAITDVYLHMNKRAGAAGPALDLPRGFQASAELQDEDQEVQEDHLRGMKHADKPLMFGDGTFHALPGPAGGLKQLKLPMQIKGHVLKGPMKGPITIKVAPVMLGPVPGAGHGSLLARPRPLMARVKPMVVLVRPMSSNRLPYGGKGPADASKPLKIAEWLASMWKGG